MFKFIMFPIVVLVLNFIITKKNLLQSNTGYNHQLFINNSVPLSGGIYILFPVILIYFPNHIFFISVFILLFFLGLFSDLNIFSSSKKRFLIQTLVILIFVLITKTEVLPSRIEFIDNNFQNTYWSYFFTTFCLMILINGSNFIDGLNGLFIGYLLIIILILYKLNLIQLLEISNENILFFIFAIFFIFILNLSNKLFIGDSGAYSLSFLLGFTLITIYNLNQNISPYFIILLLWYPCFENLYSIIRKFINKKSPLDPDNNHLHHYLFIFLKTKLNFNNLTSNISSSLLINLFNLIVFYFASLNANHTIWQLYYLFFNIIVYVSIYTCLYKYSRNIK